MDVRAFNEWEHKVNEYIQQKIASLRKKHINRRKEHVLNRLMTIDAYTRNKSVLPLVTIDAYLRKAHHV